MEYSFEDIWSLLKPKGEYVRRVNACGKLWSEMAYHRRKYIYETIAGLKTRGEYVNPNPLFAIKDNDNAEPMNYRGKVSPAGVRVYSAKWNGKWGMYTREDIETYGLITCSLPGQYLGNTRDK